MGRFRDFQNDVAHSDTGASLYHRPIHTGDRQVLAGGSGVDGVTFALKFYDSLSGEQAHRAIRPAMEQKVSLPIPHKTAFGDLDGPFDRPLWNAAIRNLNRFKTALDAQGTAVKARLVNWHEQT